MPPTPFGAATTSAPGTVGKVSVSAAVNVMAVALALPNCSVKTETPPDGTETGVKAFAIVGGLEKVTGAVAGSSFVTPSAVVSAFGGIVLV